MITPCVPGIFCFCGQKQHSHTIGPVYQEEREINDVVMIVRVVTSEVYHCPCGREWGVEFNIPYLVDEKATEMARTYTLANAIDWLRKMSEDDFCDGEQNYARLILKRLIACEVHNDR